MAAFSNYLEDALLNHLFKTTTLSKPATVAVALCTAATADTQTGATLPEVTTGRGYARLAAPSASWGTVSAGAVANASALSFGPCTTSEWGTITHVAIVDSTTAAAGNVLFHGALSSSRYIQVGDSFEFAASDLTVSLD